MCRWLAYRGNPIFVRQLVLDPRHSLIDQSLSARMSDLTTNGDGFGLGWYGLRPEPGIFRTTQPAWNDMNLRDIANQTRSALFLAHVRAATGALSVQETNCHPFRHGRWLFQHNGLIREFERLRRPLMFEVDPELFSAIRGTTDSEVLFYLTLTHGLEDGPLAAVERAVGVVERIGREHGVDEPVEMTIALSDGAQIWAVRYASSGRSRSLFAERGEDALRGVHPDLGEHCGSAAALVVSEPLTDSDEWNEIPESSGVIVTDTGIEQVPFQPR